MVLITWLFTAVAVILATLCVSLLLFLKKRSKFWEERGVPGPKPHLFFGNVKDSMMVKLTEAEVVDRIDAEYKDQKVVGIFNLWKPIILVKDWKLARLVLENDADYFTDHPPILSEELSDYAFYSLFTMEGEPWKTRRHVLTKLFTPMKLKGYLEDIRPGLNTFMKNLDGDVECLEKLVSFTAQTIVLSLYGLDLSNDTDRTEELVNKVQLFIHPPISTLVKVITYSVMPVFFRLFKISTMPVEVWNYASSLFDELVQSRKNLNSKRNDGLSLIMKLQEEGAPTFDKIEYKEAVGHMFQFLLGGVHTSAAVMANVLLQLANRPDVQEKVRQEVEDVVQGAPVISYEHLGNMKYLESVLLETMRLEPLLGIIKRTCTKDYELVPGVRVAKGDDLWVGIGRIQRDPELFPDSFLPERWLNGQAEHAAYFSFGKGPRACIGKKLAEMQAKLLMSTVISNYELIPSKKNRVPYKANPNTILITSLPLGGAWVKFQPRR